MTAKCRDHRHWSVIEIQKHAEQKPVFVYLLCVGGVKKKEGASYARGLTGFDPT